MLGTEQRPGLPMCRRARGYASPAGRSAHRYHGEAVCVECAAEFRAYMREYERTPERRAKKREWAKEYRQQPNVRQKRAEYMSEYWAQPGRRHKASLRIKYRYHSEPEFREKMLAVGKKRRGRRGIRSWSYLLPDYCERCGSPENLEVDHVRPVSLGGSDDFYNAQHLCAKCNKWKSARHVDYRSEARVQGVLAAYLLGVVGGT